MFSIIVVSKPYAHDIPVKYYIGGILAGAYQYQWVDGDENKGRSALSFQPEFSFQPTAKGDIFAKFGLAAGNGLNDETKFNLRPWVAHLEDEVKNINRRNRDYLLTAWYKHTFKFTDRNALDLTGGIIDSRDYVDENAYANDQYTQFMNEAPVTGPNGFFPSYDIGGAAEEKFGNFDITALGMNIGENDDGNNYNYLAGQIVYKLNFYFGGGRYRLIVVMTSKDFLDENGESKERQAAGFISFDQELCDIIGAWIRFGWQNFNYTIRFRFRPPIKS